MRSRFAALVLVLAVATGCSSDETKPDSNGSNTTVTKPPESTDLRDSTLGVLLITPWPKDGAGVQTGQWRETRFTSSGVTTVNRVAVVGEAGPLLKIEETSTSTGQSSTLFNGFVAGLTVEKATGKVVEAIAAKKGEKGKEIKVAPTTAATEGPASTSTDESVTVAAGTYPATKTVTAGQLSETVVWVGKDGDVQGISLRESSDDTVLRELKSIVSEDLTVSGKPVKTFHATYSDGSEAWFVRGPGVPFATTDLVAVKQSRAGTTIELSWGDDAKPEIDWAK